MDEEVDPLDAYMAGIEQEIREFDKVEDPDGGEQEEESEMLGFDDTESIQYERVAKFSSKKEGGFSGTIKFDSEGNEVVEAKGFEVLPLVDHSKERYETFRKKFYREKEELATMKRGELNSLRKAMKIHVWGGEAAAPISSFEDLGLPELFNSKLRRQNFTTPTPIQRQALPIIMSGRDICGVAVTGSGKTLAFVIPMLYHVYKQRVPEALEGPSAIVLSPTRDLAQQTYNVTKSLANIYGLKVAFIVGGGPKYEQFKEVRRGVDIVIATPGRLIDMIKMKGCKLNRTTFLVIDEADKCFDLGFEPQIRSLIGQIRPDRQTTMKKHRAVERLVDDSLTDPIFISVGGSDRGVANEDITQVAVILDSPKQKWKWLVEHLPSFEEVGGILIFVSRKEASDELSGNLEKAGFHVASIHGDKLMNERIRIIHAFKNGAVRILVGTDVASRGLDIPMVKTVVNFDVPKSISTHIHRIGRTGRAGEKGDAFTLLTRSDFKFASQLVSSLEAAGQAVADDLVRLAMKDKRFRRRGSSSWRGRRGDRQGSRREYQGDHTTPRRRGQGIGFSRAEGSKDNRKRVAFHRAREGEISGDLPGSEEGANKRRRWEN